jgi:hypothetical protein
MKNEKKSLADLNDQELRQEVKKRKGIFIAYSLVIGLMIGVAIYNATHKGSFIISCLPLFFMAIFVSIERSYKEAKKELKARGLEKMERK